MMTKTLKPFLNSLPFWFLFALLLGGSCGVNWTNKLAVCPPFFVCSLLIALLITEAFGKKAALIATLSCLFLNLLFYKNVLHWGHAFSWSGLLCASYVSIQIFSSKKLDHSFPIRIFWSLLGGVMIDALIMMPWEFYTFEGVQLWSVIFRSFAYKVSYVALFSLGSFLMRSRLSLKEGYENFKGICFSSRKIKREGFEIL